MGLGIASGVKCSANPELTITYLGTNPTGLPIGPARPDRIIVAIGYGENDAGGSMTSCTFNAVAGTIINSPTLADSFGMAYKYVTTGTTCDVAITQYGLVRYAFYMITGVKSGYYGGASGYSPAALVLPAQPCAIIHGVRNRHFNGSGFGAYATGPNTKSHQLDLGINHAGGGNPAIWAASGYSSGVAGTYNAYTTGAFSDVYGFAAVFY